MGSHTEQVYSSLVWLMMCMPVL